MAITVTPNQMGSTTVRQDELGYHVQVGILVEGLTPGNNILKAAIEAVKTYGYQVGYAHDEFPDSFCNEISTSPESIDKVLVIANYIPVLNVPRQASTDASLTALQTNKDKNGNPIKLIYTYPQDYENDLLLRGVTAEIGRTVDIQIPTPTLSVTDRLVITASEVTTYAKNFVGKVNESGWSYRLGDPARTWLCTNITGAKLTNIYQNGIEKYAYDVTYSFAYNANTWDIDLIFIDPQTNEAVTDVNYGSDAYKTFEIQGEANFNQLI